MAFLHGNRVTICVPIMFSLIVLSARISYLCVPIIKSAQDHVRIYICYPNGASLSVRRIQSRAQGKTRRNRRLPRGRNRRRARFPKESSRYLAVSPGAKLRYKDSQEGRSFSTKIPLPRYRLPLSPTTTADARVKTHEKVSRHSSGPTNPSSLSLPLRYRGTSSK